MRDHRIEAALDEWRAAHGAGPVIHVDEVDKAERAQEERELVRERAAEAADMSWLTENSGCHMSETEKQWHPEDA